MLVRIKSPDNIPAFLEGVKNKKEKLFGFGHRVYKNFDPRAKLIQQIADEVCLTRTLPAYATMLSARPAVAAEFACTFTGGDVNALRMDTILYLKRSYPPTVPVKYQGSTTPKKTHSPLSSSRDL
jgi:hypothetical protein